MNARLAVAVVLLGLTACGGEEEEEETGVPLFKVDSALWEGPHTVKGTVTLPADTQSGVFTQFEFVRVNAGLHSGNAVQSGPLTTDAKQVRFEITNLEDGEYKFRLFVDQSGNNRVDAGDYEGWYGGTLESPVLTMEGGKILKLEGRNHEGIDFGLGLKP
jgi:hypothetical protein